jgi:hypothetical protein
MRVNIRVARTDKHFLVHRLVLAAFVGASCLQTNHKNGVRNDNRLENLEWCNGSENAIHAFRVLHRAHARPNAGRTGAANKKSKRVQQTSLDGTLMRVWDAVADVARAGLSEPCISRVCAGKNKQHKGFVWAFINQTNNI